MPRSQVLFRGLRCGAWIAGCWFTRFSKVCPLSTAPPLTLIPTTLTALSTSGIPGSPVVAAVAEPALRVAVAEVLLPALLKSLGLIGQRVVGREQGCFRGPATGRSSAVGQFDAQRCARRLGSHTQEWL